MLGKDFLFAHLARNTVGILLLQFISFPSSGSPEGMTRYFHKVNEAQAISVIQRKSQAQEQDAALGGELSI